jgi:hypothetical protein
VAIAGRQAGIYRSRRPEAGESWGELPSSSSVPIGSRTLLRSRRSRPLRADRRGSPG